MVYHVPGWLSTTKSIANRVEAVGKRYGLVAALAVMLLSPIVASAAAPAARVKWTADIGQPIYNTPRIHNKVVYLDTIQSDGPNVFAVKDGKILWKYATGSSIPMPVTLGGDQVFAASDVGQVHFMRALNAKTGLLIWDYARSQPPECMCSHVSHYVDRMLFAQTDGHNLYALDPQGNTPARRWWAFAGDGAKLTTPVVVDGEVIFGSADHCIYAVNATSGKVLWKHETGYGFVARPAVAGKTIIAGDRGGNIYAYAAATGKSLWTAGTGGPIGTPAVIYHSSAFIAAGYGDWGIYAFSVPTGKRLWYTRLADYTDYAPVVLDRTLIVASRDGKASGISPETGKILWSTNLHGVPLAKPIVDGNSVVIKVGDHRLVNIDVQTGKILWAYHTGAVITAPVIDDGMAMKSLAAMQGMRMPASDGTTGTVYIGTNTGKLVALN